MKKMRDKMGQSIKAKSDKMKPDMGEDMKNMSDGDHDDMDEIMNDHTAKSDLATIIEAEMIRGHKDRMGKVHKLAGRHKKAITSLDDIKAAYADKVKEEKSKL